MASFELHFRRAFLAGPDEKPHSLPPSSSSAEPEDFITDTTDSSRADPSSASSLSSSPSISTSLVGRLNELESALDALQTQMKAAEVGVHLLLTPPSPASPISTSPTVSGGEGQEEDREGRCWAVVVPRSQAKAVREACKARDYNGHSAESRRSVLCVEESAERNPHRSWRTLTSPPAM